MIIWCEIITCLVSLDCTFYSDKNQLFFFFENDFPFQTGLQRLFSCFMCFGKCKPFCTTLAKYDFSKTNGSGFHYESEVYITRIKYVFDLCKSTNPAELGFCYSTNWKLNCDSSVVNNLEYIHNLSKSSYLFCTMWLFKQICC